MNDAVATSAVTDGTIAEVLAHRIQAVGFETLPADALHWAKVAVLDTVGRVPRRKFQRPPGRGPENAENLRDLTALMARAAR